METQERVNIKELKAHKVFGPGYFIQRQMDVRGWTQQDLADVLGLSVKEVNHLLQNKQSITFETTVKISIVARRNIHIITITQTILAQMSTTHTSQTHPTVFINRFQQTT